MGLRAVQQAVLSEGDDAAQWRSAVGVSGSNPLPLPASLLAQPGFSPSPNNQHDSTSSPRKNLETDSLLCL